MLKFVRVMAGGADANYEQHLSGVQTVFGKAFPFHPTYTEKLADYAAGHHPEGAKPSSSRRSTSRTTSSGSRRRFSSPT